jgi:outer membrane immunogenic protein
MGRYLTVEAGLDFDDIFTRTTSKSWRSPWFATLRGRIGFLVAPQSLLYGTGGLAIGRFELSSQVSVTCRAVSPGTVTPSGFRARLQRVRRRSAVSIFSDSATRLGWVAGGGIEQELSRCCSIRLEYLS